MSTTSKWLIKYNTQEHIAYVEFSSILTTVDIDLAKETREHVLEITHPKKFGMIVDFKNILYIENKALSYWAKDQSNGRIIAVAGCYKNNPIQNSMIKLFLNFKKPTFKIKFFTNCVKAKEWIKEILKNEI